ncbi:MAG: hypothetical protein K0S07_515 [Chlamydiales bacterium]|jgi:hypothetical protein|nr:hypothetical protein [Chlamydiales bacterium]
MKSLTASVQKKFDTHLYRYEVRKGLLNDHVIFYWNSNKEVGDSCKAYGTIIGMLLSLINLAGRIQLQGQVIYLKRERIIKFSTIPFAPPPPPPSAATGTPAFNPPWRQTQSQTAKVGQASLINELKEFLQKRSMRQPFVCPLQQRREASAQAAIGKSKEQSEARPKALKKEKKKDASQDERKPEIEASAQMGILPPPPPPLAAAPSTKKASTPISRSSTTPRHAPRQEEQPLDINHALSTAFSSEKFSSLSNEEEEEEGPDWDYSDSDHPAWNYDESDPAWDGIRASIPTQLIPLAGPFPQYLTLRETPMDSPLDFKEQVQGIKEMQGEIAKRRAAIAPDASDLDEEEEDYDGR